MLGVFITILKILGITLLVILSLIILLLLIILFVPIRYRIYAEEKEGSDDFCVKINVSFLLHIFSVWANYKKGLDTKVKVFGINISTLLNRRKEKKNSAVNSEKKSGCTQLEDSKINDETEDNLPEYTIDWNEDEEIAVDIDSTSTYKAESIDENDLDKEEDVNEEDDVNEKDDDVPSSFKDKIRVFVSKISELPELIFDFLDNLEDRIDCLGKKVEKITKRISYYDRAINDYRNRQAIETGIKECKYIIRKIIPKKCTGSVKFGFEDPATLGSVLMYIGMLSPILPRKLEFIPIYDEEVFNGYIYLKGSFTIFTFVLVAFRLYFNKNVRRLYRIIKRKK